MNKLLAFYIVFILSSGLVYADSMVIDNSLLQHYRGATGRWMHVQSLKDLKALTEKYGSGIEQVREINHSFGYNRFLFIPFSADVAAAIEGSHGSRSEARPSESGFVWPLSDVSRITSAFGMRNGQLHVGIDLPAYKGSPIVAAMDGRVEYAHYEPRYGKLICIGHRDNFYTRYSHNSEIFVKKGDFVRQGQIIGLVGSTGHSTGNHLHFEIRFKDIPLNPIDFLPENGNLSLPHRFIRNWK